jgi:hypothetical protein
MNRLPDRLPRALLLLMLAYGAASLLHFAHNAEFLAEYPNMPAWLTRAQVYGVWLGITAIGVSGALLVRSGNRIAGLAVIAVYAAIGFDGLAHYTRAPLAAHTAMMNATIWLEAIAAAALLAAAIARFISPRSP